MSPRTPLASLAALSLVACGASRTTPTPQPASSASTIVDVSWTDTAALFAQRSPSVVSVRCPPAGHPAPITGTDVYTADSSLCTAALHAGRVSLAMGGVVSIELRPPADGYVATLRNGVASRAADRAPASFSLTEGPAPGLYASALAPVVPPPPAPDPWTINGASFRGQNGEAHHLSCPPGTLHNVWGTDVYTDDSSVCSAAVHAGRITAAEGGDVTFFTLPGRAMYFGSIRHDVTSSDYGEFGGSIAFDRTPQESAYVVPPGARLINGSFNASSFRGQHQTERFFCPPDVMLHTVWGTGEYTDDSSICSAAIHAGVIEHSRGGVVTIRPTRGHPSYHGSTANGVTTQNYDAFDGSFVIVR